MKSKTDRFINTETGESSLDKLSGFDSEIYRLLGRKIVSIKQLKQTQFTEESSLPQSKSLEDAFDTIPNTFPVINSVSGSKIIEFTCSDGSIVRLEF